MHPDFFISYSGSYEGFPKRLVTSLETRGRRCWVAARDLVPESDPATRTIEAIKSCRVFVFILSASAVDSGRATRELEQAVAKHTSIVLVRADEVTPPEAIKLLVRSEFWIDAYGEKYESCVQALLRLSAGASAFIPPGNREEDSQASTRLASNAGLDSELFSGSSSSPITTDWAVFGSRGSHIPSFPSQAPQWGKQDVLKAEKRDVHQRESVEFSVVADASLRAGSSSVIEVWAYLPHDYESVLKRVKEVRGERSPSVSTKSGVQVQRGTTLVVRAVVPPAFHIQDSSDSIFWDGQPANARFVLDVSVDISPRSYPATVYIYLQGMQIARIPFTLCVANRTFSHVLASFVKRPLGFVSTRVQEESQISEPMTPAVSARVSAYKNAFASYASEDRDSVLARIQGMRKVSPEFDIFVDVVSLRSADKWRARLEQEILGREVFYLFWSEAARRSAWVEKEWRYALEKKGIDHIDPVPLVSPEIAPPPPELAEHLHFNDWMLAFMRNKVSAQ
jgi:hypothetical protein